MPDNRRKDRRARRAGSEFFSLRLSFVIFYSALFFPTPLRWIATKIAAIEPGRAAKGAAMEEGVKEGESPIVGGLASPINKETPLTSMH
jgi:hypothetical protein